jgi:hypothetical protein
MDHPRGTTLRPLSPPGLLEQAVLLLRPADDGRLLLAGSGEVAGFARRRGWLWPLVEVREQEESPLVCTIRRRVTLWPRHDVRDADGELVGVLAGRWVLDRWQRLAFRVRGKEFADAQGDVLGRWAERDGELRLELLPAVQHEPFTKMLILAALLAR